MKKALVFGLLSCLLFNAECMKKHNKRSSASSANSSSSLLFNAECVKKHKKPSASSANSSSSQLTLSERVVQGKYFNPNGRKTAVGLEWGYEAMCNYCTYIELYFDSRDDASKAANLVYKMEIGVKAGKFSKELQPGNIYCEDNKLRIDILDTDVKHSKNNVYSIQSTDSSVPQPISCEFGREEE